MRELTITLTEKDQQFIQTKIESGHYVTPSEAIAQAIGELHNRKEDYREQIEELRRKLDVGLEQL